MNERIKERKQIISVVICWLTYTFIYFGRYSYSANIALVEEFYHKSHSEAGLVMTLFSIAYGSGQLLHGLLCKRYPRRITVPIILGVSALMDFLVFSGVPFYMIKYLWFVSAVFQSALWPLLLQVISENVSDKYLQKTILVMGTTSSVGILLVYGVSAVFAKYNFKWTFLLGAVALIAVAIIWFALYEKGDCLVEIKKQNEVAGNSIGKKGLVVLYAPIALLVLFSILTNFLKDGLQTWVPVILKSLHGVGDSLSIILTLVLPLFGVFGASAAVLLNEKIKKIILLIMFFFAAISAFVIIVLLFKDNLFILLFAFAVLEFLLHGVCGAITNIFPLKMRTAFSSGFLGGVLNGSAYIGSATSSYLLGKIADVSGWDAVFITFFSVAVSVLIFGSLYWILATKKPALKV